MLTEVMEFFGLVKEFRRAGYYETDHLRQLFKEIEAAIRSGKLIALTGVVGCGKTVTLRRLQENLKANGKILVSKSLSVDKSRATLPTLIAARRWRKLATARQSSLSIVLQENSKSILNGCFQSARTKKRQWKN
jgi:type II secretory pathway predicted ATPase ExeA